MKEMYEKDLYELVSTVENSFVKKAKEKGKPIVGYTCLATPREIFDAAGIFPYRLKGFSQPNTEMADAYLSRFNCGFCRACLQLGLDGSYDFLDGLVETNGCDHLRGMFENWQYAAPRNFFHYVRVPHLRDEDSMEWFMEEMELLIQALQKHFGVSVDEDSLKEAIERQERIAEKLKEIYTSRWEKNIKVSGSEVMALTVAEGSLMPEDYEKLLDDFGADMEKRSPLDYRARIFMGGAATDEVELITELEDLGGIMVADSFCFGGRLFRGEVSSTEPIRKLAEMYMYNLLCPRMYMDYQYRRDFIMEMIRNSGAEAAVFFHNKFCDIHGIENVQLRNDLEKEGIPVLHLEKEYGAQADIGRLKTRVQALMERLKR